MPVKAAVQPQLSRALAIQQRGPEVVAIGAARNAGLLAVRILAAADPALAQAMTRFQGDLRAAAEAKGERVRGRRPQG